ncbi:MAG: ErfK/YbiS/YcfS/YnhG family protein [Candidatus Nomurabacteria bacterium]|nr:ErfK/YbiS/YcfS/YnhG family protein [Candidatus Nomurabacteria bacterium]
MKNTNKIVIGIGVVAVIALAVIFIPRQPQKSAPAPTQPQLPSATPPTPPIVKEENVEIGPYTTLKIKTAAPLDEITATVGAENVATVLKINRINSNFLKTGSVVIIPANTADFNSLSPFPTDLPDAANVSKLMMISQRVQAFGLYENGKLVRWGPVSTGKQSTPTASKLYFTNWKGEEIHSSFSDEWVLKWNFNLDNKEGIGMHQYEMPGYPASHSCVRMFATDAEWIYNWADQWIVSDDEQTVLVSGTPVIVFGSYSYGKTAPWKNLPKDAEATTLSQSEVEKALSASLSTIQEKQQQRIDYLAS